MSDEAPLPIPLDGEEVLGEERDARMLDATLRGDAFGDANGDESSGSDSLLARPPTACCELPLVVMTWDTDVTLAGAGGALDEP